jgi:hypothetical protein
MMAQIGKFIFNKFKGKHIEFTLDRASEWVEYSDHTAINETIMSGTVLEYDEDSGVITLATIEENDVFYVSEESISVFWEHGKFQLLKHTGNMLNTGRKYIKKDRDIM